MLNSSEIKQLIVDQQLITNYIDLEKQIQPSGFDLSLSEILDYKGAGSVDFSNIERVIAKTIPLETDKDGWHYLKQGSYVIVYNEVVRIPLDIVALARSRSTILRNGGLIGTAVWDPGYQGRSSSLLVVHNPYGLKIKKDARVAQLIFFRIKKLGKGYDGIFQRERLKK